MAQISYGSITIIDTNDIERIYPVYCKGGETNAPSLQPLINWSENVSQAGGDGDYIWQRIVAKKQGIAVTAEDYSDAVRLTGDDGASLTITSIQYAQTQNENDTPSYGNSMPSPINEGWWLWVKTTYSDSNSVVTKIKQGQKGDTGISVTGTKEIYFLKRTTDNTPTAPADGVATTSTSTAGGIWTTVVPNYIEGGIYYTSIQTTYSSGTSPKSSTAVINQGLTDANAKALAAYNTSTARDTEINALQAQAKYFWWDSEGAHVASGESGGNIEYETPTTYKFNALMAPGSFKLRYNNKNFAQLTTGSLTFFRPAYINGQYEQGKKAMELNSDALTFYKPLAYNSANEPTVAATLNANGLVLSEGGIVAGTKGQTGYIYLSTANHPVGTNGVTINGFTPTGSTEQWREVIGTKFGVTNAGTLYANNAVISGTITVGGGSDLSAGLGNYSTTSQMNSAINTATNDMATQTYVTGLGYQTESDVNSIIADTSVADLSDGSSYSTTTDMNTAISNATNGLASKTETVKSVTTETQYRLSNNSDSLTGSGTGYSWSTTIPTWSSGKYLWTRIATTYTPISGNATTVYTPGTSGNQYGIYDSQLTSALSTALSAQTTANGAAASVTTTQQYNLSSSTSSANGTWQDTVPTWSANNYIWVRLKIVKTPMSGTATTSYTPSENGTYDSALTTALSTAASAQATANAAAPQSSAIAEEQLIYIQATSGTNSVSAYPSSSTTTSSYWVTQTGESIPNGTPPDSATGQTPRWTTKCPSYQKNYPVIFVAKQKKTVSGAITCTTPIKDDTTTIIDGGHITTGTIDASKVTVTNLQASSIAVGNSNVAAALDTKASSSAEYEVVIKINSIDYINSSATLIAIPTKLGESTTGSFVWYKNAINTAHGGTVSTTTNTNDTLTVSDLEALYIAVLQ